MFCLLISSIFCRFVMLQPKEEFVIYDDLDGRKEMKFLYDARDNVRIQIFDSENKKAVDTNDRSGCIYLQQNTPGLMKINIYNESKNVMKFSYKAPDVTKEKGGQLGYVNDSDLVGELTNLLDKVIDQQNLHVEKSYKHYEMVKKSRKWVRFLVVFELCLTGFAVYLMHKDFVSLFETKRKV
ncbi:hypothetical protein EHP00_194 [Ecytonucleospora hepatopenaei]|uniref:GOLD domain-containing protein n=1 Tax=Ecytonucleospora hepatopenaei TaxID=646526 RepID=A0A1W0E6N9_9MICR|nr:hypothetical protein EHP00_194 [Ecytonucleospora hepatopenaei]